MKKILQLVSLAFLTLILMSACAGNESGGGTTAGNPFTEDDSASGAVAAAVGGALSGTSSNGTLAAYRSSRHLDSISLAMRSLGILPQALASANCPTFATAAGATCSASGGTIELVYNNCQFTGSQAEWSGAIALLKSAGSAACGTFPNPGNSGTLTRQYVEAAHATNPSSAVVVSAYGTTLTIDDATANLGNFDNQSISALVNSGYGTEVFYDGSDKRTGLTIAHRIYTADYDHSINGSLTVNETTSSSRTVTGSIKIYHNIARIVGTSSFSNVVHQDICCLPVSGSITTTFSAGQNVTPTAPGSLLVGKSETLTFTGCGTATLLTSSGTTKNVNLARCY